MPSCWCIASPCDRPARHGRRFPANRTSQTSTSQTRDLSRFLRTGIRLRCFAARPPLQTPEAGPQGQDRALTTGRELCIVSPKFGFPKLDRLSRPLRRRGPAERGGPALRPGPCDDQPGGAAHRGPCGWRRLRSRLAMDGVFRMLLQANCSSQSVNFLRLTSEE